MGLFRKIAESNDLVTGMTSRLGIDMAERMMRNPERETSLVRSMAMACMGCNGHLSCALLQADSDHLDAAPAFCRNRETLAALQAA